MYPPNNVNAPPTSRLISWAFASRGMVLHDALSCMTLSNCLVSMSAS